jgi:hypothetical protein
LEAKRKQTSIRRTGSEEEKLLLEEWGEKKRNLSPSPPLSLEAKRKQTSIRRMGREEEKPFSFSSCLIGSQEKANFH